MPESSQIASLDEIISMAQKIKEATKALESLKADWLKRYPSLPLDSPQENSISQQPSTDSGSIDDRIVEYLDANPDREFNVNMINDELKVPPASLGTQLSKLYRSNKIARVGRGYYRSLKGETAISATNSNEKEVPEGTS